MIPFPMRYLTSVAAAIGVFFTVSFGATTPVTGGSDSGTVGYAPPSKIVQGNQGVAVSYVLTVTAPTISAPVSANVLFTVLSSPTGVAAGDAANFISANPSTLNFSNSGDSATTVITVAVPTGAYAGNYAYQINTQGWASTISDGPGGLGATVNANITPIVVSDAPPQVTATIPPASSSNASYSYNVSTASSVTVPISFTLAVPSGSALLSGVTVTCSDSGNNPVAVTGLSWTGSGTQAGSGTASFSAAVAGNYTVTVSATDTDSASSYVGTGANSATASVVVTGPPPVISKALPTILSYTYTNGGAAVSVSIGCTATSPTGGGNITGVSATYTGPSGTQGIGFTSSTGVNSATTATVGATLSISTASTYTVTYNATNAYGSAVPVTVQFTVAGVNPVPTIAITAPANNATFQIAAGATSVAVPYTLTGGTTYGTITSVTASLSGPTTGATAAVTPAIVNLNTPSITGSGTLNITAAGTYTLSATDMNNTSMTASASTTFTVTQVQVQPPTGETVVWLPPVSCGQSYCGGSVIPVEFKISNNGTYVSDTSIVVAIYQTYKNGTSSTPVLYTYNSSSCSWGTCNNGGCWWWGGCNNGSCSNKNYGCGNWTSCGWNACTTYYTIGKTSLDYKLYFPTDTGVNTYVIQVFKQLSSNPANLQLLATTEVVTQNCGTCYDNNGNQCQGKDDNWGNCNLQRQCWGNNKCGSNSWGGSGCYGNCDGGGWTNNCGYNGSSSNRSCDNNSCNSNSWGGGCGW